MLDAKSFRFIEMFTRDDLAQHPVWHHFDEGRDRARILAWGVAPEQLAREVARFQTCGPEPLYPVLALDALPEVPNLNIAVVLETAGGARLEGYLVEPHAFGVYVGDLEIVFNQQLPARGGRQAQTVADAMGIDVRRLFPLRYRAPGVRRLDGRPVEGEIPRYW